MLVEPGVVEQRYQEVLAGASVRKVARQTVHTWLRRYASDGLVGLVDRSSKPGSCPHQVAAEVPRPEDSQPLPHHPQHEDEQCTHHTHQGHHDALDRLTSTLNRGSAQIAAMDRAGPAQSDDIDSLGPPPPSSDVAARVAWQIAKRQTERDETRTADIRPHPRRRPLTTTMERGNPISGNRSNLPDPERRRVQDNALRCE